ncbi:MAG: hypothetical protein AB1489_04355 [Acidobacteriota bacterium]
MVREYMLDEAIEAYRDRLWRRDPELRVETVFDAERFVEEVGFAAALTDARRPGPSLYIAVCGRRDVSMPRNVQKDVETSHTWVLKDDVLRRGNVYYAKLAGGRATFLAPRLIPVFQALWGIPRTQEKKLLSQDAQAVLRVLRKEWEMASADLREASGISERGRFTKALDELQACLKVIPSEVVYVPKFTYIWSLTEGRFGREPTKLMSREQALTQLAKTYLTTVGECACGELARATGLSRPEAGKGNHALVREGFATRLAVGVYRLTTLKV